MQVFPLTLPGGNWASFFRLELKWRKQVLAEVARRETPPAVSAKKSRSIVTKGLLASFFPSHWRRAGGNYVFVSFGKNQIVQQTRTHTDVPIVCPSSKARNLVRGDSLAELDAIYQLIHFPGLYPDVLRKMFLRVLLRWISRNVRALADQVFITNHDYYGQNSILVTLSQLTDLNIVGLQHGLLRHDYLSSSIYPGYRNHLEAVYSQAYQEVLTAAKRPGARLPILGAPFDVGNAVDGLVSQNKPALYFISSDDLRFKDKRAAIDAIFKSCQELGVDFYLRPHPQELSNLDGLPFALALGRKDEVFKLDTSQTLFVGHYSTFLYEAALRGYRTIWITPPADQHKADAFPEIRGVPNTFVQSGATFNAEWLKKIFSERAVPIASDPVGPRMARLLEQISLSEVTSAGCNKR
ncbi:hypothetical protein [Aquabacterium sp. CECT 9606]|uniref:hypothetical protein n=1 Tax=Aquabacterium sp. CECT 9606 TaxID=2845822 RepID=UPI001E307D3E|nr:hypothetical protein [Aquabacterium sp. CECT 9606]CAH0354120.1 hypothetical protein AQB9606_03507 [Aquabacterium sp. CECT 9606]